MISPTTAATIIIPVHIPALKIPAIAWQLLIVAEIIINKKERFINLNGFIFIFLVLIISLFFWF